MIPGSPPQVVPQSLESDTGRIALLQELSSARQALLQSEQRYRALLNSIGEGYCVIQMIFDPQLRPVDYRFLEVSPLFEQQTGLLNALGKTIRELVPGIEAHWFETYGKVALTGEPVRFENRAESMNRWFDVYAFRFGGPQDRQVSVLFSDISKRKQAELDLSQAKLASDKANQAKSEHLTFMSHELRTPLNAILGFAQLMDSAKPPPTPSQKRSLAHIVTSGWYLLKLINETLDIATIESGAMRMEPERLALTELLYKCHTIITPLADQRNIRVNLPLFELPVFVDGDRVRVKQILINLLSNAVKYNRTGGSVDITCESVPSGHIRISVHDTGEGLNQAQMEQLFKPFNRLGRETGDAQGTGIGLVMCKRLIELMNGKIGVDSTVGKGSIFWIELKAALAPEPLQEQTTAAQAAPASASSVDRLQAVLHVDDNPANIELIEQLIAQRPGHRVLNATHAGLALEFARAHQPAVILMDVDQPGMGGIESLSKLREDPTTSHIPVLALSANALPHDVEKGLQAGFFRYITKPINVHEFMKTVGDALVFSQASVAPTVAQPGKPSSQ